MKHLAICGTIITKESALDFIARRAKQFYRDMSMEASAWLDDIEQAVVEAGLMSLAEIEEAEKAALACKERDDQSDKHYRINNSRPGGYEGEEVFMIDVKSMCDTCKHDKYPGGCEYACAGVEGWDEKNEVVTACNDYEAGRP